VKDAYPEMHHIRSFFGSDNFHSRDLPNEQVLDWDGLPGACGAVLSLRPKTIKLRSHDGELGRIFSRHQRDGYVRMEYFTRIYFGQLRIGTGA